MKKEFYVLSVRPSLTLYTNYNGFRSKNEKLGLLYLTLDPIEDLGINAYEVPEKNMFSIWAGDSFKQQAKIDFKSEAERKAFEQAYDEYYNKRWNDMPHVQMSLSDYNDLQQKWEKIKKEKSQFIIFSLDDSELLDKVDLIGKNELSDQDLHEMKQEHEQYLAWIKAEQLYNYDHEIIDDIWRSPADSVYDVDIEKYVGRKVGFIEHKKYTKKEVIEELQEKLQEKKAVYLIIHWLYIRKGYGIEGAGEAFEELLQQFGYMDMGWESMISSEQLQDIADRLAFGQDVKL